MLVASKGIQNDRIHGQPVGGDGVDAKCRSRGLDVRCIWAESSESIRRSQRSYSSENGGNYVLHDIHLLFNALSKIRSCSKR